MRIAVVCITGGGMSGGFGKHLRRIVPLLARHGGVSAVHVVTSRTGAPTQAVLESWGNPRESEWRVGDSRAGGSTAPAGGAVVTHATVGQFYRQFTRWPSAELVAQLGRFRPDVLFVPNFRLLLTRRWPQVVMVRNMEPLVWSDPHNPPRHRVVNLLRRAEGRLAAWQADRLIAVSHFVERFLTERWRVPTERVGVVYHGADSGSLAPRAVRPEAVPEALTGHFVFAAGTMRPYQGFEDLVGAVAAWRAAAGTATVPPPPVVIAGRAEPAFRLYEHQLLGAMARVAPVAAGEAVAARAAGSGAPPAQFILPGVLNEQQMAWCYEHSRGFVMTTRVEACPNVALEAMSYGCVSVAADNPPLPEMFAHTAQYYPPRDSVALADRLQEVLALPVAERSAWSQQARARAATFSWEATADGTVRELGLVCGRGTGPG